MIGASWFSHTFRARYQETDQMGVVYHGNFLSWFEMGRFELFRELGFPFRATEAKGVRLMIVGLEMRFMKPAHYDDEIGVRTRILPSDERHIHFESRVTREQVGASASLDPGRVEIDVLAAATTRHVWTDAAFAPIQLSHHYPELAARIAAVS
jgi:acyl-CoA thioester hydrolase